MLSNEIMKIPTTTINQAYCPCMVPIIPSAHAAFDETDGEGLMLPSDPPRSNSHFHRIWLTNLDSAHLENEEEDFGRGSEMEIRMGKTLVDMVWFLVGVWPFIWHQVQYLYMTTVYGHIDVIVVGFLQFFDVKLISPFL